MGTCQMDETNSTIELADDLVLRQSNKTDLEQLAEFNSTIHFFVPDHSTTIPAMTIDLLDGICPEVESDLFTLVVEKKSKRIVSAMALIPQTWSYGGISFKVGRPELVGTDPKYRGKGLIRAQFDILHKRSKNMGHLAQAITGIPLFYRQFGYEFAVPAGGGRFGSISKMDEKVITNDDYLIRDARMDDLIWIEKCYQNDCSNYLVSCNRDIEVWRYELETKNHNHIHKMEIRVITDLANNPVGFFICPKQFSQIAEKCATWFGLLPEYSWWEITPIVLRFLLSQGKSDTKSIGGTLESIGLELGDYHPAYSVCSEILTNKVGPSAWYFRIDNVREFLTLISPKLESRIQNSSFSHFEGTLRISSQGKGITMTFINGLVDKVESYILETWEDTDVAFPYLSFYQLLMGFRSLEDLKYAYPDCWCQSGKEDLVNILFPKVSSNVLGIA
jgi:hypothetical protein